MTFDETLIFWKKYKGQTGRLEIRELYDAIMATPDGDVVEVGSATGGTTIVLIGASERIGKTVYSIDPYPESFEGNANDYTPGLMKLYKDTFQKNILSGQWKNIIQYNETVTECIDKIPDKLSVVFIDGCHEYFHVLTELELLFPRLVKDGMLFIHDTNWNIGQVSKVKGSGVSQITQKFYEMFSNVKKVDSMLCGKKI